VSAHTLFICSVLQDILAPFVAEACLTVMPPKPRKAHLAVDNVRIAKLQGGSIDQCSVIKGMVSVNTTLHMFASILQSRVLVHFQVHIGCKKAHLAVGDVRIAKLPVITATTHGMCAGHPT
jgi:chaperonin GroEL (HSP60 family)